MELGEGDMMLNQPLKIKKQQNLGIYVDVILKLN